MACPAGEAHEARQPVSRTWCQRVRIDGKLCNKGLGSFPEISLSHARKLAAANKRALAEGRNPWAAAIPTFREASEKVLLVQREIWRGSRKAEKDWRTKMDTYVLPVIGSVRVDKLTTAQILGVLSPLWNTKRSTAQHVRNRIGMICRWCIVKGYRQDDPTAALGQALPKNGKPVQHRQALPPAEVPTALAKVMASEEWMGARMALWFLTLTAARSGEVRGATWSEIDSEGKTWTVPAGRSKTGQEHKVPLSPAALACLAKARGDPQRDRVGLSLCAGIGNSRRHLVQGSSASRDRLRRAWHEGELQNMVRRSWGASGAGRTMFGAYGRERGGAGLH